MNKRQLRSILKSAWRKEDHLWDLKERSKENWDQLYKSQRSKLLDEIHSNGFTKKAKALNILVTEIRTERNNSLHRWSQQFNNCFAIAKQLKDLQKSK